MTESGELMVLSGGFAREPAHGDLDDLTSLPGPPRFLRELFGEACGVDVSRCTEMEPEVAPASDHDVAIRRFLCGTEAVGYSQSEVVSLETTAIPIHVAVTTFGLPGMELHWDYALSYQGQLGHCGFEHGRLAVRFRDGRARELFESVWRRVFGHGPEFSPVADG